MSKLTFSLDDETVRLLRKVAEHSRKPQSLVVREAIAMYAAHEEKLSDAERTRLMDALGSIERRPPTRPPAETDREIQDIRRTRRTGWSRPVS